MAGIRGVENVPGTTSWGTDLVTTTQDSMEGATELWLAGPGGVTGTKASSTHWTDVQILSAMKLPLNLKIHEAPTLLSLSFEG